MDAAVSMDWRVTSGSAWRGELIVPGDKSISHRALMLASLADGSSSIDGLLDSADIQATQSMLGQMGVRIEAPAPGARMVHGVGMNGLEEPPVPLQCGNSGTAMRLFAGLLAGQPFASTLQGDASLSNRPMLRILSPLREMGASIAAEQGGLAPLRIRGGVLDGIDYRLPVASAQVKSAVLLAGLYARGTTCVHESTPTRDYTESMLAAMGWPLRATPGMVALEGGHRLRATPLQVPGDFSSAAFFIVAAALTPGSDLLLRGVGMNPRRTGLLRVLQMMGADITVHDARKQQGEAVADLRVRHAPLHGIDVPAALVADMIDEFPALFIAAAGSRGQTRISGAAELRVKECDRIAVMAQGLKALGIAVVEAPDGATITGGLIQGGEVHSHGDHRVAMSFAIAAGIARAPVVIRDTANVATSFPSFARLARDTGLALTEVGP